MFASGLRKIATLRGPNSRAAQIKQLLLDTNEEFRRVWNGHEVGVRYHETKWFVHRELGDLDLTCQVMVDPEQGHSILVYTAIPGTESYEKLQLLNVIAAPV
ncbi:MmyB family transcriptional regulator [Paractinoplanes hotanensis]|uniref:MmyB-like transcription regulator ligand binding domain-containing protein n=1 Tax=Paractinoplanes hotanensis TaxID=2906497 RepID=A0ABT0YEX5_9ACTN|nr:hypothetical protein [Actinoplanes hotanensis]MCM4084584.1 hypothetical protein [Actinoplanes hotanensis]